MARSTVLLLTLAGGLIVSTAVPAPAVTVRFREGGGTGYINLTWDAVSINPPSDSTPAEWQDYHLMASSDPAPPTAGAEQYYLLMAVKDLLGELPIASADITSATLIIIGDLGDGDTAVLHRVTTDWLADAAGQNESDTSGQQADVSAATTWTGGSFSNADYDTGDVASYSWPLSGTSGYPTPFDVTAMVKAMYDAAASYGWCLTNSGGTDKNIIPMNPAGTDISSNAVLEIVYSDAATYGLTVNSGSGGGSYTPGTQVSILADPAQTGYTWVAWTGDTAWVYEPGRMDTIIEMPPRAVAVTATYAPTYPLTVNSGTGSGDYTESSAVAIDADDAVTGLMFDQWVGDTGYVSDPLSDATTVTMPVVSVEVTATYTDDPDFYSLTVNSGTGGGPYQWDSIVAIAADPPDSGYVFKCWVGDTGTIDNVDTANTTITIPQADSVITATYKWAPYALTINSGKRMSRYPPSPGEVTPIAADAPGTSEVFDQWVGDTDGIADVYTMYTNLTMPSVDQEVTATYKPDVTQGYRVKFREYGGGAPAEYTDVPIDDTWLELGPADGAERGSGEVNMEIVDGAYANQELHEHVSLICVKDLFTELPVTSGSVPVTINSAFLSLYRYRGPQDTPLIIARVLTDWVPDEGGSNEDDCSGLYSENSTYTTWTDFMTNFGPLDYDGAGALQAYIQSEVQDAEQKYDITSLIREMYALGDNYGLALIGDPDFVSFAPGYDGVSFRTSEYGDASARPVLQIDYQYGYILTVNSGTGDGQHIDGTVVPILADPAPSGEQFGSWAGDTSGIADVNAGSTVLLMPAADSEVTATYTDFHYTLTVSSGGGSGLYPESTVVAISANPAPSGEMFDSWIGDTDYVADAAAANTTVTMPDGDVSVTAAYVYVYTLTVNSGSGGGQYVEQADVPISAGQAPTGLVFHVWMGDVAVVGDVNDSDTTVTMPAVDTEVTATYTEYYYTLAVTNGSGSGQFIEGSIVPVSANPPPSGKAFAIWVGDIAYIADRFQADTTVAMPAADVDVTAAYALVYTLTVSRGSGDGDYLPGAVVSIGADPPTIGQAFEAWTGDTAGIADVNGSNTTITMPVADTEVTATYTGATYTLTVNSGTGGGQYVMGQVVGIDADLPATGMQFYQWTGDTASVSDTAAASTTVTMPPGPVEVTATYTDMLYALTVNSGTGGGQYVMGQVVGIDADLPATGMQFYQWTGDTASVFDTVAASTTVTMPPGSVEVTAIYTDIPPTYWPGDIDRDFLVSGPDLDIVLTDWGHSGTEIIDPRADISGDNLVSGPDLDVVLSDWGKTGSPP